MTTPLFFKTPAAFRAWLRKNHAKASELQVGYFKKDSGKPSITWPESVAEALCFGWIDGIRRSLDGDRYTIRFTPRRPKSIWSAVNIRLIGELEAAGKMTDAGRAAFRTRPEPDSAGYKAQKKVGKLDRDRLAQFKKHRPAWAYFRVQPPSYRSKVVWWVMQAKQEETRNRRLEKLIDVSAECRRLM